MYLFKNTSRQDLQLQITGVWNCKKEHIFFCSWLYINYIRDYSSWKSAAKKSTCGKESNFPSCKCTSKPESNAIEKEKTENQEFYHPIPRRKQKPGQTRIYYKCKTGIQIQTAEGRTFPEKSPGRGRRKVTKNNAVFPCFLTPLKPNSWKLKLRRENEQFKHKTFPKSERKHKTQNIVAESLELCPKTAKISRNPTKIQCRRKSETTSPPQAR